MQQNIVVAQNIEGILIDRNEIARIIEERLEVVTSGIQTAMCSDCCGSNGNGCDPNDTYPY